MKIVSNVMLNKSSLKTRFITQEVKESKCQMSLKVVTPQLEKSKMQLFFSDITNLLLTTTRTVWDGLNTSECLMSSAKNYA